MSHHPVENPGQNCAEKEANQLEHQNSAAYLHKNYETKTTEKKKQGVYYSSITEKLAHGLMTALEKISPKLVGWIAYYVFYTPLRRAKSEFSKPIEKQDSQTINAKKIKVYLAGEGPAVLLVHGWEMSAARYEPIMQSLVENGFSVVTCDLPAHGKSEGKNSDIVEIGQVIMQLNEQYGPFVGAVGHSYGAAALCRIAHKLKQQLKVVVLIACPVDYQSMVDLFSGILGLGKKARNNFIERIHRRYKPMRFDQELDFRVVLNNLERQIIIIHDENDRMIPIEQSHALVKGVTNAIHFTTTGLGHQRLLKDPQVINQILSSIKRESKNACLPETL